MYKNLQSQSHVNLSSERLRVYGQNYMYISRPSWLLHQPFNGHIKTAKQRIILHQYGDWYTGDWRVDCYIWYSEEGLGGLRPRAGPSSTVVKTSM